MGVFLTWPPNFFSEWPLLSLVDGLHGPSYGSSSRFQPFYLYDEYSYVNVYKVSRVQSQRKAYSFELLGLLYSITAIVYKTTMKPQQSHAVNV